MARSRADDVCVTDWRPRQLAFDLAPEPGFDPADFLVSDSNRRAHAMIELWPDWPDPVLLVIGPPGSGKSHLGSIWSTKAGARVVAAASLGRSEPEALAAGPLLVEGLETLGNGEAQLFHLVNLMRERGAALVLTARSPPEACGIAIADLLSRLRLAPRVELGPPDEALIRAVLVKLLVDRQLVADENVVNYAALRLERSLQAARAFIDALDRQALSRKSRITRTLASEVMRGMGFDEDLDPPA